MSNLLWHSLDSDAELPLLVSHSLSSGRGQEHKRKAVGGYLYHLDSNHDTVARLGHLCAYLQDTRIGSDDDEL